MSELDGVIAQLRQRAAEIDAMLGRLDDADALVRNDRADATADDEHDPEGSTLSGEWQRIDALRRSLLAEHEEIAAALARVDAGTYGICIVCGAPIPAGRLEARPMATMCVACASRV